jgi:hypothetical protein
MVTAQKAAVCLDVLRVAASMGALQVLTSEAEAEAEAAAAAVVVVAVVTLMTLMSAREMTAAATMTRK